MTWLGLKELEAALEKVGRQADLASRELVSKGASLVEAAAKGNFQGQHPRGYPHVVTSPPRPNVVTGNLRRSIKHDTIARYGIADYGTKVGPRAVYGRRVELGYKGSAAYPYFKPAVEAVRPRFHDMSVETYRKFLYA